MKHSSIHWWFQRAEGILWSHFPLLIYTNATKGELLKIVSLTPMGLCFRLILLVKGPVILAPRDILQKILNPNLGSDKQKSSITCFIKMKWLFLSRNITEHVGRWRLGQWKQRVYFQIFASTVSRQTLRICHQHHRSWVSWDWDPAQELRDLLWSPHRNLLHHPWTWWPELRLFMSRPEQSSWAHILLGWPCRSFSIA